MQERDDLLSIAQAAEVLGIHKNTLRAWALKGQITHVQLPSGYRRFRRSELLKKMQEMQRLETGLVEGEAEGTR